MQVKERNNSWLFTYIFIFLLKLDLSNTSLNYVYESILNAIHQPIYMCMRLIFTVFFTKDEKLDIFYLRNMIWKRPAQVISTLLKNHVHAWVNFLPLNTAGTAKSVRTLVWFGGSLNDSLTGDGGEDILYRLDISWSHSTEQWHGVRGAL